MSPKSRSSKHCKRKAPKEQSSAMKQESQERGSRRNHLSCGECRRLKLKCDRVFPCQSCVKRGCSGICPDGVLTAGAGSRYVLANTEQLHDKIMTMGERIRHLEAALEVVQNKSSCSPHPLLRPDLLLVKNSLELYAPNVTKDDRSPRGNADELETKELPVDSLSCGLSFVEQTSPKKHFIGDMGSNIKVEAPHDIAQTSRAFPIPWPLPSTVARSIQQRVRDLLPLHSEAENLCKQARENAFWQYNIFPNGSFLPTLVHEVYSSPSENLSPRRLALLLMVLTLGCVVDVRRPTRCPDAQQYYQLARAALCEIPVTQDTDITTVQTLFLMTWYLMALEPGNTPIDAWAIMGLNAKLAQGINLHHENKKWEATPGKLLERRALYWELMNLDARMSISVKCPCSLNLRHTSCEQPNYDMVVYDDISNIHAQYYHWKHNFLEHCLYPVLEIVLSPKNTDYTTILRMDAIIRDFPIPCISTATETQGGSPRAGRSLTMQQNMIYIIRESALLQLHRPFMEQAVSRQDGLATGHKYAPSAIVTYQSLVRSSSHLTAAYTKEPELCLRFACFWNNLFSVAITLCLYVSKAPQAATTPFLVQTLDGLTNVFGLAVPRCSKAAENLVLLWNVIQKVQEAYARWGRTAPQVQLSHIDGDTNASCLPTSFGNHYPNLHLLPPSSTPFGAWEHVHPEIFGVLDNYKKQREADIPFEGFSTQQSGPSNDLEQFLSNQQSWSSAVGEPRPFVDEQTRGNLWQPAVFDSYPHFDGSAIGMVMDAYANRQFTTFNTP